MGIKNLKTHSTAACISRPLFFSKETIGFKLFNGTTHAGKIKAYIQFCLALSALALTTENTNLNFKSCSDYTKEQKYILMNNILTKRLKMTGPEYSTARLHLTKAFAPIENSDCNVA